MTQALVQLSPPQIVEIYGEPPSTLRLPTGDIVEGAVAGWSGGGFALIVVQPFSPPTGQIATGAPSYAVAADGSVTETYATVPAAAPMVSSLEFRKLFTEPEQAAITTAGQSDVQIRIFMDDANAAGTVDLGAAEVTQGIAYLVGKSLLTQDRANLVLAGTAPQA